MNKRSKTYILEYYISFSLYTSSLKKQYTMDLKLGLNVTNRSKQKFLCILFYTKDNTIVVPHGLYTYITRDAPIVE